MIRNTIIALLFFFPSLASAATFYVDASCVSNGNGTTATCGASGPWNSLAAALQIAECSGMSSGDILEIKGETTLDTTCENGANCYFADNVNIEGNCHDIIIQNAANEHVIVDGTTDISGSTWTSIGSGVYECQTSGCSGQVGDAFAFAAWYDTGSGEEMLTLEQSDETCDTSLAEGKMRIDQSDQSICVHLEGGTSPASAEYLRVPTADPAIQAAASPDTSDNITLRANPTGNGSFRIQRYRKRGIEFGAFANTGWVIDGLHWSYMMDRCIAYSSGEGNGAVQIKNNTISFCGQEGIRLDGDIGNFTISGNTITDIQTTPVFEFCEGVGTGCLDEFTDNGTGIRIVNRDGVGGTVANNTILRGGGGLKGRFQAINLENHTSNVIVENNYIADSTGLALEGTGIKVSVGFSGDQHNGNIIRNNRIFDVDRCYWQQHSSVTHNQSGLINHFVNNTCVRFAEYGFLADGSGTLGGAQFIQNNLFDADNQTPTSLLSVSTIATGWVNFQHNGFECDSCTTNQDIVTWKTHNFERDGDCTSGVDCIADTKDVIGSGHGGNVYGDMNVTKTGETPTLHITAPSAAIDAGKEISQVTTDYAGTLRPPGSPPDIGAYEVPSSGGGGGSVATCTGSDKIYVSPSGGGSTCSDASPCTLNEGTDQAQAGDTVCLKNGTYTQSWKSVRAGSSGNPITFKAVNRHQAIVRFGPHSHAHFHIDHSWITVSGLRINAGSTSGTNAHDASKISNGNNQHAAIQGVVFEDNYVHDAGHLLIWVGNTTGTAVQVRHNTFDFSGIDDSQGEANYLGSASDQNPAVVEIHHNVYSRYKANAVDFKGEMREGFVYNNFFMDHRVHECTCGTAICTHNNGVDCIKDDVGDGTFVIGARQGDPSDSTTNNRVVDNVIWRPKSSTIFWFTDPVQVRANGNVIVDWQSSPNVSSVMMQRASTQSYSVTHSNIHCPSEGMSHGSQNHGSNPANQINQPIGECNDRIDEIVGVPEMVSCEIGGINDTTVTVNIETNKHPPVSSVGALQVTYDGVGQSETAVTLASGQQARITMASAPSSSATVRVVAADGDIKNSAFIGGKTCGNGDDYGNTDYTRGQGFCGENEAQTLICSNSVEGGEPPPEEELSQAIWRFYKRHGAEGERAYAAENTDVRAYPGDKLRWRVGVRGGGANAPARGYTLAARLCNPTCGQWTEVSDDMSVTGVGFFDDQIQLANVDTTNQLSLGGKTFVAGKFVEAADHSIPSLAITTTQQVEWEYSLQIDRGGVLAIGDVINLRMQHDDGTPLETYTLPSITISHGRASVGGNIAGGIE